MKPDVAAHQAARQLSVDGTAQGARRQDSVLDREAIGLWAKLRLRAIWWEMPVIKYLHIYQGKADLGLSWCKRRKAQSQASSSYGLRQNRQYTVTCLVT